MLKLFWRTTTRRGVRRRRLRHAYRSAIFTSSAAAAAALASRDLPARLTAAASRIGVTADRGGADVLLRRGSTAVWARSPMAAAVWAARACRPGRRGRLRRQAARPRTIGTYNHGMRRVVSTNTPDTPSRRACVRRIGCDCRPRKRATASSCRSGCTGSTYSPPSTPAPCSPRGRSAAQVHRLGERRGDARDRVCLGRGPRASSRPHRKRPPSRCSRTDPAARW